MNGTTMTVFGITFIFLMTALGSAAVYCFKRDIPLKVQAAIFGFAAGIMLAASVWSLLLPALSQAEKDWGRCAFIPVLIGFLCGGALIVGVDRMIALCQKKRGKTKSLFSNGHLRKLFLSMTLHNIPEGLAVGFAFGGAYAVGTLSSYVAALGLAIGVGIQNLPEGAAVSLPIKATLNNKRKAFYYGLISAIVEPIFALMGYFFAARLQNLQPWLLAFSAGAMIFVVAEELLPEARKDEENSIGAWGAMLGFAFMMVLDVALG